LYSSTNFLRAGVKFLGVGRGPPIVQVAVGVILAALVVEAWVISWPMTTPIAP